MNKLNLFYTLLIFSVCFCEAFSQLKTIKFITADTSQHNLQGTWTTTNYIEIYESEDAHQPMTLFQFNSETSYYLLDGFALTGALFILYPHGYRFDGFIDYEVRNTIGIGGILMMRWEFVQLFGHNLFAETGFGILTTNKDFPPFGTRYNFTQRYGFGMNIPLNKNIILVFGVRHVHISNGKGFVRENPQFNGNGAFLGIKFEL